MKEWKTAEQIEAFIVYRMQESGVCAGVASVAVEASGTGWVARIIGHEISDECRREFEAAYQISQAQFHLLKKD
jgi:hypothetical protein